MAEMYRETLDRLYSNKVSHKKGILLRKEFAVRLCDTDRISLDGKINPDHPRIEQTFKELALFIVYTGTDSQARQRWNGAIAAIRREGRIPAVKMREGAALIKKASSLHVPAQRKIISQQELSDYLQKVSDYIFGKTGERKSLSELRQDDIHQWLLLTLQIGAGARPSEISHHTKKADPEYYFNIVRDLKPDPANKDTVLLYRPKKQLRQKQHYERVMISSFCSRFAPEEQLVSIAQTLHLVRRLAKRKGQSLNQPLWAASPGGYVKETIITTRDHTKWRQRMAIAVGITKVPLNKFNCRGGRRAQNTSLTNSTNNKFEAATLSGHGDINSLLNYHCLGNTENATLRGNNWASLSANRFPKRRGSPTSSPAPTSPTEPSVTATSPCVTQNVNVIAELEQSESAITSPRAPTRERSQSADREHHHDNGRQETEAEGSTEQSGQQYGLTDPPISSKPESNRTAP